MSQVIHTNVEEIEKVHKTLLCLKNVESEFGLFCGGAHAMLLSIMKDYIKAQEEYFPDRKEMFIICAIADGLYDWFETFKRQEAMDAESLEGNHRLGEKVMGIVRKVRAKERGEDGE